MRALGEHRHAGIEAVDAHFVGVAPRRRFARLVGGPRRDVRWPGRRRTIAHQWSATAAEGAGPLTGLSSSNSGIDTTVMIIISQKSLRNAIADACRVTSPLSMARFVA